MKKTILSLLLIAVFLLTGISSVFAKSARAGAEISSFNHACDVLAESRYCYNVAEGAKGKLVLNTPEGDVSVVFTAIFDGLEPNNEYTVYLASSAWVEDGVWPGGEIIGTFWTDEYGHGDFHYNIMAEDLDLGTHTMSVWVNDNEISDGNKTLFVSDNFEVVIE